MPAPLPVWKQKPMRHFTESLIVLAIAASFAQCVTIFGGKRATMYTCAGHAFLELANGSYGRMTRRTDGRWMVRLPDGTYRVDGRESASSMRVAARCARARIQSPDEPKVSKRIIATINTATDPDELTAAIAKFDAEGRAKVDCMMQNQPFDRFNVEPKKNAEPFEKPNEARRRYGTPCVMFAV